MHSRLAVLMMADMVGYSRLMEQNQSQAIEAVNELRKTYLEPVVEAHNGEILKRMGDGWIAAFSSVVDQVQCAMEVQSSLVNHRLIKLRIGAHIGEIFADSVDFYGAGVNLAQRLQTEAPPGGLLVSQALYQQIPTELQTYFRDAGSFRLKNIAQPVNGFQWRPNTQGATDNGRAIKVAEDVPTIAVEPFELAPDKSEIRAASADLRDQIIMRLSRRTGIRVLDEESPSSKNIIYLLQGRLRVSGNHSRFYLKFVLPSEGRTVFSQTYERDTSDIFDFCDDVVEQIDSDLRLQINAFDAGRIAHLPDDVLSVSELRSRAASVFYGCTIESFEYACRLMDRALQLNPSDAMSLAMRAGSRVYLASARHDTLDEMQIQGLETDLNMAVELIPRSDYIFATRAFFRVCITSDINGAAADAERALSLGPALAFSHQVMGLTYMSSGDWGNASYSLGKAVLFSERSPFLPGRLFLLAVSQHLMGEQREAIDTVDRAIQLGPRQWCFHLLRSICCRAIGDETAATVSNAKIKDLPRKPSVLALRPPLPAAYREFADQFSPG